MTFGGTLKPRHHTALGTKRGGGEEEMAHPTAEMVGRLAEKWSMSWETGG